MFELVLIVCLIAAPERCEEIYLREEASGSMMQCLFNGPKQAARWAETHEGWFVKRWRCGLPQA